MKCERFLSIPVFMVFLLVCVVCYGTLFIFIEDWVGLKSYAGSLNALILISLASFSIISFIRCVLSDPGYVPASYVPDIKDSEASDQELKKNGISSRRCDKCSSYKPPRAHHCRVCRRCVLRMDHHCPWINNCVGYSNYKAFLMLVVYATLGSLYSTVMIIYCASYKDLEYSGSGGLKIFYVMSGVMMASLSVILGTLLGFHVYLIIHNMTTIEHFGTGTNQKKRFKSLAKRNKFTNKNDASQTVQGSQTSFGSQFVHGSQPTANSSQPFGTGTNNKKGSSLLLRGINLAIERSCWTVISLGDFDNVQVLFFC